MITEKLNYITIVYHKFVESIKLMIQEHYDIPEYGNTIFFITTIPIEISEMSKPYSKKIFYTLEHNIDNNSYYSNYYNADLYYAQLLQDANITEIWTMDYQSQFALTCNTNFGLPIVYKPVRYTSLIKPVENIYTTPKVIDFGHIGAFLNDATTHRDDIFNKMMSTNQISFKLLINKNGENMSCLKNEMNGCRFILDVKRLPEILTQNQVRIFELLCMGYTVCVEKCPINMFPGLIYEWDTVDDLINIIKNCEYLSPTEAYKEMTYSDEAYEKYVNSLIEQWNTLD